MFDSYSTPVSGDPYGPYISWADVLDQSSIGGSIQGNGYFGAVPEPTTIFGGALLLLPFGASTLRLLRRNRAA
jgi:hypothetical protein